MFNDRFFHQRLKKINICLIFVITVVLLLEVYPGKADGTGALLSATELQAMVPKIRQVEQGLSNLKLEVESWVEKKDDLSDTNAVWERTPIYWHCTGWVDCSDWEKWRIDVHDKVGRWTGGTSDYYEEKYSVSSDANERRIVFCEGGPLGNMHTSKEAEREAYNAGMLDLEKNAMGIGFSMHHFFEYKGGHLSTIFEKSNDPCVASFIDFTREEYSGKNCIRISVHKGMNESYWVDPNMGFSLVKYEKMADDGKGGHKLIYLLEVTELKKIAEGIWWPVEMTFVSCPTQQRSFYTRDVYHVINALANDPNFDESIFTVPFPDGYKIEDKITGKTYIVGQDPNAH